VRNSTTFACNSRLQLTREKNYNRQSIASDGQLTARDLQTQKTRSDLICDQSSLRGLWRQDYRALREAVMICAALVNKQTDTHTQTAHQAALTTS